VRGGTITGTLSSQSDLNTALGLKAPLASPALTGAPTAPTPTAADNSTKVATTAYVDNAVSTGGAGWVAAPVTTHSTDTGTYNNDQSITVGGCASNSPYYSTNGTSVTQYVSTPVAITATGTTLKSRCMPFDPSTHLTTGLDPSAVKSSTYTLQVATPTHSPDTSTITSGQAITVATTTTGSPTLKYCTDAVNTCDPTTGSTYSAPITSITTTGTYLRSIGTKASYANSTVKSSQYTILPVGGITIRGHGWATGFSSTPAATTTTTSLHDSVMVFVRGKDAAGSGSVTITSPSISSTGMATNACSSIPGTPVSRVCIFILNDASAGLSAFTSTFSAFDSWQLEWYVISGANNAGAFTTGQFCDTGFTTNATCTTPSVTLAGSGAAIAYCQLTSTNTLTDFTVTTGYTQVDQDLTNTNNNHVSGYKTGLSAGSYSAVCTATIGSAVEGHGFIVGVNQ
jgi:hypothetical protein